MATSDPGRPSRVLGYLESRRNLTGCALGLAGVGLALTGLAGAYWPVVVAGLYGAGALIVPPEPPPLPPFSGVAELDALRKDFAALRAYLAPLDAPPKIAAASGELDELLAALLEPGPEAEQLGTDPEAVHVLARAIRQDVPEAFDAYLRTRRWARLAPGSEPPERHLERQLTLLLRELGALAAAVAESLRHRQEVLYEYLRSRAPEPPDDGDGATGGEAGDGAGSG